MEADSLTMPKTSLRADIAVFRERRRTLEVCCGGQNIFQISLSFWRRGKIRELQSRSGAKCGPVQRSQNLGNGPRHKCLLLWKRMTGGKYDTSRCQLCSSEFQGSSAAWIIESRVTRDGISPTDSVRTKKRRPRSHLEVCLLRVGVRCSRYLSNSRHWVSIPAVCFALLKNFRHCLKCPEFLSMSRCSKRLNLDA